MNINCYFLPQLLSDKDVAGKVCVVFDILRASSTMVTALENGCRRIIPVATPKEARAKKTSISKSEAALLAGEREGKKISGFDLGNSPAEFRPEKIKNKTLIMCTTNGTKAILSARKAQTVLVGCFLNLRAVAGNVQNAKEIVLLCSGKEGKVSLEDLVACGALIDLLANIKKLEHKPKLDDSSLVALDAYIASKKDIVGMLKKSNHGKYLASIGFENDLVYCARRDTTNIVPYFNAKTGSVTQII